MTRHILVTGGAGYIGSHMVKLLLAHHYRVTVLDNLSAGYRDAVPDSLLVVGDIGDPSLLARLFQSNKFDAVMHFASFTQVAESVIYPEKYHKNNVNNTLVLLQAMRIAGIDKMVFSSSAAVYGNNHVTPIKEDSQLCPINPYGKTKLMVEQILRDYADAYAMRSVSLRYFNAAGADPDGALGERHDPETHLIPLVLQTAAGLRHCIRVFGNDYDTPDGTCIRDYVHVSDLCEGHLLALKHLLSGGAGGCFNLGSGVGVSVMDVILTSKNITQKSIPLSIESRRMGDPSILIADISRARSALGWTPKYSQLGTIISHAWQWQKGNSKTLL
jgi:UDP-glucose 4-epimerase